MRSIRLKLWSGMMILVAIVLLLLWFFQIVFLERFYLNIRTGEVKNRAYGILQKFDDGYNVDLEDQLDEFTYNENLSVEVLDLNGTVIYSSGVTGMGSGHMPMMRNNARAQALGQVISGHEVMMSMVHMRFGNRFILIGLPIKAEKEVIGAMLINMPVAPVEATATILKKQLILITIILLIVSIVISSFMSETLTRPVREITKAAKGMASGNFNIKIEEAGGKDEIGTLAHTFNHMAQELSRIDELKKELIANVSHDLRTPLSLIRGYAETIRDVTGNDPAKREKQLNVIIEESQRLGNMVDDVLNLSQIQSGYMTFSIERFNLYNTLNGIVKKFNLLCIENNIKLELKSGEDLFVLGDESKIEQVLYNLVNNALNHSHSGGVITISSHEEIKTVRVEVKDTGLGIPEGDLKNIWDRYYMSNNKRGYGNKGHGLGLAIVKSILEAHDIPFGVVSKEGEGTTFWLELNKDL